MPIKDVKIEESWKEVLSEEFEKLYFENIKNSLLQSKKEGKQIYPPGPLIFNAFDTTPFGKVKVVIVGQDPYHNPGEAMGLCFSVPERVRVPPSLVNIFKEIKDDLGLVPPGHGNLTEWAEQGVFLLNAFLTVEHRKPASHRSVGWEKFTDSVIVKLSELKKGLVFLLWGRFAQSKGVLIDQSNHYVLTAPHPSPLARGGFFGNRHFSKTNELLISQGKEPINWQINQ